MIRLDEDALICDFAETYHITDYRSLPARLAATLAAGLRDDSRIKLIAADVPVAMDTILLAAISDRLDSIRYGFASESDRAKRPPSILSSILGGKTGKKTNKNGARVFRTAEEFRNAYEKARGKD